jgi:hypothetical protein
MFLFKASFILNLKLKARKIIEKPQSACLPQAGMGHSPVRNSSGALNLTRIVVKFNPAAEQGGIISNGVKGNADKVISLAVCLAVGGSDSRHGSKSERKGATDAV